MLNFNADWSFWQSCFCFVQFFFISNSFFFCLKLIFLFVQQTFNYFNKLSSSREDKANRVKWRFSGHWARNNHWLKLYSYAYWIIHILYFFFYFVYSIELVRWPAVQKSRGTYTDDNLFKTEIKRKIQKKEWKKLTRSYTFFRMVKNKIFSRKKRMSGNLVI